jgi:hypothetical protein
LKTDFRKCYACRRKLQDQRGSFKGKAVRQAGSRRLRTELLLRSI